MNQEQVKSLIRWVIATFGPILISHGYVGSSTVEMISGVLISAVPLVWSMLNHTEFNAVAVVATIAADPASPVKAPILENTTAGRALATDIKNANPDAVVVVAGSYAATQMASSPMNMQATSKSENIGGSI